MKKYSAHRSGLFLMELIIAILFFSIAGAICLQLFVKSHTISRDTQTHDQAVNAAASVASVIQSSEDTAAALKKQFPDIDILDADVDSNTAGSYRIYYDQQYLPCPENDAEYYLEINAQETQDRYTSYHLAFWHTEEADASKPVYTLDVDTYHPYIP